MSLISSLHSFLISWQTCACGCDCICLWIMQSYFLAVEGFLVQRRKLTPPRFRDGSLEVPPQTREQLGTKGPPELPSGVLGSRGSQCPVSPRPRVHPLSLLPGTPNSPSGTWTPLLSACVLLGPAPVLGSLRSRVCVLTSSVCCLPLAPSASRPVALYSMRNLSRPSLTQYELDSKSPCMAAPESGPGLPQGWGAWASEATRAQVEWWARLRPLEEWDRPKHR